MTASKRVIGTALRVSLDCRACHNTSSWSSQPHIGKIPAGNILLSATILFSGALITKTLTVFQHMGVACISPRTYFRHQKEILFKAVRKVWQENQLWLFASLQVDRRDLVVGGDGRADSPGHSAKYGTYSLMEMEALAVVDIELVQVLIVPILFSSTFIEKIYLLRLLRVCNRELMIMAGAKSTLYF